MTTSKAADEAAAGEVSEIADMEIVRRLADGFLAQCGANGEHPWITERWAYVPGMLLTALNRAGEQLGVPEYTAFVRRQMDSFVREDGSIRTYRLEEYNLDQINQGKNLFALHRESGAARYARAADLLAAQLISQPRTSEGGFWHKKVYPFQMWLDGLYMASPFLAEYGRVFNRPELIDEAAHQLLLIERRTRDPRTGLLYHGWDESGQQEWADSSTGLSAYFWSRAMGWYAMAAVDSLEHFPQTHRQRGTVIGIFQRMMGALLKVQDAGSGLWRQVLDQGERPGNYLEASGSCMFVYALAKGLRLGYLEPFFTEAMRRGYEGILRHLVTEDEEGVHLHRICHGAGLSIDRNGSYDYYISEAVVSDAPMGVAPLMLALLEVEKERNGRSR
ncbi:glycoside hydrolase family 88 protein [Saccharibacillus sp. CPCC 101409]|uniref:glycoside hydrolase family 88/105 protein n=1 Tax=Saccharibacillus sp. CPCC 101409 TaxID=3058041 RepID=UPI002672BF32|nr:glycoside hydrolase family 88 protein [Saccharibacillus sp. CPCC 101409]MDO3412384.1 glycoside hydrolase family 88 protein [Saccharibacillus sp. CPCC 101409]